MVFIRKHLVIVVLLIATALLAGCNGSKSKSGVPVPPLPVGTEPPQSVDDYLVYADFADDAIGQRPAGWIVDSQATKIEVVAAPDLPSGKALRLASDDSADRNAGVNFNSQKSEVSSPVIALEHLFKWTAGKNNMYVRIGSIGDIKIHWWVTDSGVFGYRNGSKNVELSEVKLDPAWNKVRIIADRRTNEYTLYLNDTLIDENIGFSSGRTVDTWEDHRLSFQIPRKGDGDEREYFVAEVKVWEVDI